MTDLMLPIPKSFQVPSIPTPQERCYWVVEELLLAGAYPGRLDRNEHTQKLTCLWEAGMRTFINLVEEDERNADGDSFVRYDDLLREMAAKGKTRVSHLRFPIRDRSITSVDRMRSILDAIDLSLMNKTPVYLHCYAGIGRMGTVVCCWLLRHGIAQPNSVLDLLTSLRKADEQRFWRTAPENNDQCQFVLNWPEVHKPASQQARLQRPKPAVPL